MADDRKFLRELFLKIDKYGQEAKLPTNLVLADDEKVTSNSDEASGHVQEAPSLTDSVPGETQSFAGAGDDNDRLTGGSSDDAVHSRAGKKRKTHSVAEEPLHSSSDDAVQSREKRRTEETQTVGVAEDEDVDVEERTPTDSTSQDDSGDTQSPTETVNVLERAIYLGSVEDRFPAEDYPYKTYEQLLRILIKFENGEMVKSEAHGKACILLIGHSDLLQGFERLLNHDDEQDDWRSGVMKEAMRDIDMFLDDSKITVKVIKKGLTADHRRRIEMLIEDPVERIQLLEDLQKEDPSDALLRLGQKVDTVIERMKAFVSEYFGRDLNYAALYDQDPSESWSGKAPPKNSPEAKLHRRQRSTGGEALPKISPAVMLRRRSV